MEQQVLQYLFRKENIHQNGEEASLEAQVGCEQQIFTSATHISHCTNTITIQSQPQRKHLAVLMLPQLMQLSNGFTFPSVSKPQ